eukprot:GEMP01009060.1.p1 GENE.GEMP01009060.1~~GEMP01009060.1.p1  ORF type:complete len:919 (+),score=215.13 GEMP01009060.1:335-3091(+)
MEINRRKTMDPNKAVKNVHLGATDIFPSLDTQKAQSHIPSHRATLVPSTHQIFDEEYPVLQSPKALTSYFKPNANKKVDPAKIPCFRKITNLHRELVFEINHWGRFGLTDYSIVDSLAGDHLRDKSGKTIENHADTNLTYELASLKTEMNSLVPSTLAVQARADFEKIAGKALDSAKDALALINEAISSREDKTLLGLQALFDEMGLYGLLENLCRQRIVVTGKLETRHPEVTAAQHTLGVALQKQGLHRDAEAHLTDAVAGRVACTTLDSDANAEATVESHVALGVSLRAQRKFEEAKERLKLAIELSTDFEEVSALRIRARSEYALALLRCGEDKEASELLVPLIASVTTTLGPDHPDTWAVLSNAAQLSIASDAPQDAIAHYNIVLASQRQTLVRDHVDTLGTIRALTIVSSAEQGFKDLVDTWARKSGEQSVGSLCALHDLGVWNIRQGNYHAARQSFEKAYTGFQNTIGVYHRCTADSGSKVADSFSEERRPRDAEWFVRSVYSAVEANFGSQSADARKARNNVACVLFRLFQMTEAETLWECSVVPWLQEMTTLTSTEDDVMCLLALQNFCNLVSQSMKKPEMVERYRLRVWKEWSRILGTEHPNTLIAMQYYGVCLRDLRKLEDAKDTLRATWELQKKVLGEDDPDTLAAEFHLAAALKLALDFTESKVLHDHAYAGRLRNLGPHHVDTSSSEYYISIWHLAKKQLKESERMQRLCIAGYSHSYGADHYWTLNAVNALGNILSAKDDEESTNAAGKCFELAIAGLSQLFGEAHEDTLRPTIKLAYHKGRIGDFRGAADLWKRVVANSETLHGTYSPKTVSAVCNLLDAYEDAFMGQEADELHSWILRGWEEVRKMPASEMEPADFQCLGTIQEKIRALPDLPTRRATTRMTRRITQSAMRSVNDALSYFRT